MTRHNILCLSTVSFTIPLLACLGACATFTKAPQGQGLLPTPSAEEIRNSAPGLEPRPFPDGIGDSAAARTVLQAEGPAGIGITIRDVVVAPGKSTQFEAGRATLIDLRSGTGSAQGAEKSTELSFQRPAPFASGSGVSIRNTGAVPLVLRVYLLEGR